MKLKIYTKLLLLIVISSSYAQVGIGTTSPNASSMLDITSTNSGLLIPRVSLTSASDVTTIASPVTSLLVYNAGFSPNGYYYWNGSVWVQLAVASNSNWLLTGNSGTNAASNFLGTTDDIDLVFRRNNIRSGFIGNPAIAAGNKNTSFGANSLNAAGTGIRNTAIGTNVMPSNTTGQLNVSIGDQSMFSNLSGGTNTVIGVGALYSNTSGSENVALGRNALTNANANNNTALGFATLRQNVTGTNNVALGHQAGYNETGSNKLYVEMSTAVNGTDSSVNNALIYGEFDNRIVRTNGTIQVGNPATSGYAFPTVRGTAGQFLQTNGAGSTSWASGSSDWSITGNSGLSGSTNFLGTTDAVDVAFRRGNLAAGRIGTASTSFGLGALSSNTGNFNTGIGNNALNANTGFQWNTAIGSGAMANSNGAQNTVAVGFNALGNATSGGNFSVAIGVNALGFSNVDNNTAVGANALAFNSVTGSENVAVGKSSLLQNSSGAANTAVGSESLAFNGTSSNNVGIGFRALRSGGGNSVAVGNNALSSNNGANNTALGFQALGGISSGTGNVAIGNQAGSSETGASSNKLYIENSNADANNALVYGEFDTNIVRINGTLQISNPSSAPGYALPNVRGNAGEFLQTNGAGVTSWVSNTGILPYTTTGAATGTYNVTLAQHTVRVFGSISNIVLPTPVGNTGKIFIIIGSNGITPKGFTSPVGIIYDDVTNTIITTISSGVRYTVQSDGTDWIVIAN
jgi:hypothetical protein